MRPRVFKAFPGFATFAARRPASRAFTLIELLTVIAVIGVLAAILIPVVGKARQSSYRAKCAGNLRSVGLAVITYADEHKGRLPGPLWRRQTAKYKSNGAGTGFDTQSYPYIGSYIAPYLGLKPPSPGGTERYADVLTCPAWARATNRDLGSTQYDDLLWLGAVIFGEPSNGGSVARLPGRLSEVVRPSHHNILSDLDNQNRTDSATRSPPPVHGSVRNVVYFDGHVAAVPIPPKT